MAGTTDKGAGDVISDKHALACAASHRPRCWRWYIAPTTSIGTLLAREMRTRLAVVGVAFVLEGGVAAVAVPAAAQIVIFVKHGLASAATARLARLKTPSDVPSARGLLERGKPGRRACGTRSA